MSTLAPLRERVDADLTDLANITDDAATGWTRMSMSEPDAEAREWVRRRMQSAGLQTWSDAAGNVFGLREGNSPGAGVIATGSHTDTVTGGGRFDGTVGVVAALEAARVLREADRRLQHDLLVIDFFGEEPNRFGVSCVGSRALTGRLTSEHLGLTDHDGATMAGALASAGIDPAAAIGRTSQLSGLRAFVEVHIEQGPHLEEHGSQVGLVSSITGVARFQSLFRGRRDHAGTTPMERRRDAGCAAAGTVLAVERIGAQERSSRGTCGAISFTPDAVNIVSDRAAVTGELRSPEQRWLQTARAALVEAAACEAATREVTLDFEWLASEEPVVLSDALTALCQDVVSGLGYRQSLLYSGAEHDAAFMAQLCPTAMLFVPSHEGRSHCPEEWTDLDDIVAGVHGLVECLAEIDSGANRLGRPSGRSNLRKERS